MEFKLDTNYIQEEAILERTFHKGTEYYRAGRILELKAAQNGQSFRARVQGNGAIYELNLEFAVTGEVNSYHCDCQAFYEYDGACKHVVAVLLALLDYSKLQNNRQALGTASVKAAGKDAATEEMLAHFEKAVMTDYQQIKQGTEQGFIRLIPTYSFNKRFSGTVEQYLTFSIGSTRMYVLKNIRDFYDNYQNKRQFSYGKELDFVHKLTAFAPEDRELVEFIVEVVREWDEFYGGANRFSYNTAFKDRKLQLTSRQCRRFLALMQGRKLYTDTGVMGKIEEVTSIDGNPPFVFIVTKVDQGIEIYWDDQGHKLAEILANADTCYCYQNGIYCASKEFNELVIPLLTAMHKRKENRLVIPTEDIGRFTGTLLPRLKQLNLTIVDEKIEEMYIDEPLRAEVYLDTTGRGIGAGVVFNYGDFSFKPEKPNGAVAVMRDFAAETSIVQLLYQVGFVFRDTQFVLDDEDRIYAFALSGVDALQEKAEIYYSESFKRISIRQPVQIAAGIKVADTGLLEMTLDFGEYSVDELLAILHAYKRKKKYYRLQDGSFLQTDAPELKNVAAFIEALDVSAKDLKRDILELPKYRAFFLDNLARETENIQLERQGSFRKMVHDVRESADLDYVVPAPLKHILRSYQKTGYRWLRTLANYGFGGILADDMGLGKTLEVIALLLAEKLEESPANRLPALVVAPTSLVYNWQSEITKFAPELSVLIISGSADLRREALEEIYKVDIVVTSYDLLKRDIDFYSNYQFRYCIIDEAQYIKNHHTQNAKAVKAIRAANRFALTGTPIENTLAELWSVFDFLMPGYLYNYNKFRSNYELPIIKNADPDSLGQLGRQIKPFILRRMKKDVLKELPAKIESNITAEMAGTQRELYLAYLAQAKKEFENEIMEKGFEKSQIKVLALLTRLRQLCCHPALFLENYDGESGKFDLAMELIQDSIASGHRVLLFSQFTKMLGIIAESLQEQQIEHYYLDGSTPARDRLQMVNEFNSGSKSIFLISLKAGGTGLNLTGADVVIHYDPWWNPAVEEQATDRAYRIGQKNKVQVFKLVAQNSIEEKILVLQQKKRDIVDAVIQPGESMISKMSVEDIRSLFQ